MLLKVALVALVFVAVHGQPIDNPEDRVANKPIARARRGVAEEQMKNLDSVARPLEPTNDRQRRSDDSDSDHEIRTIVEVVTEIVYHDGFVFGKH
ncbi:hypothetical protein Q1695_010999 [Nippostrongylus brasiliensis]|nr:hypothetical protein Q1695_010999 [Nippostrongylus brasiliensis]